MTPISSGDHRRQTKEAHPIRASPSDETDSHHRAAALNTQHSAAAARCTAARPGQARGTSRQLQGGRYTLLRGPSLPHRHLAVLALLLRLRAAACLPAVGWTLLGAAWRWLLAWLLTSRRQAAARDAGARSSKPANTSCKGAASTRTAAWHARRARRQPTASTAPASQTLPKASKSKRRGGPSKPRISVEHSTQPGSSWSQQQLQQQSGKPSSADQDQARR